jgi:disulfide bond formation protein DsbB
MNSFVSFWNTLLSVATLGGVVVSFILIYVLVVPKDKFSKAATALVGKNILFIGFAIPLFALVGSLGYSEIAGYPPCVLCWYARVAFYPQILIFAMAIFKKNRTVIDYALALTAFGLIVTLYHSIIQIAGSSPFPCSADGISCATREVFEYGFITIPFMGFVGFLTMFLSLLTAKRASRN